MERQNIKKQDKTRGDSIFVKRSFTLIELLVVVAIIGILAAFVTPSLTKARAKARDIRRVADLRSLSLALEMYYSDNNHYPIWESDCIDEEEDNPLIVNTSSSPIFFTPKYISKAPKDPLPSKHCYFYKSDNTGSKYKLAAYLELDKERAQNDGGNTTNTSIYEVYSFGYGEQVTLSSEDVKKITKETISAYCGDGHIDSGEVCDNGASNSDEYSVDGNCKTDCSGLGSHCGDSIVDEEEGEECDTSETFLGDGLTTCSTDTCQITPGLCTGLTGLVSYWKLDGTTGDVIDSAGGNNNGTNNGATRDVSGRVGQAFSFDGNNYVEMSASNLPTTEKTMEAWFYTTNAADQVRYLLGYGGGPNGTSWYIYFPAVSDKKTIILTTHYGVMILPYDSPVPLTNAWHYVAATTDPTGSKLYLDGQLVASNTEFVDYTVVSGKDAFIGAIPTPSGIGVHGLNHWDGLIDEVAIYNEALTPEQISQHYQNGLVGEGYCQP